MHYLTLSLLSLGLVITIYLGNKNSDDTEKKSLPNIKRSVIASNLINTLILTPLVLQKLEGSLFAVVFLWIINFIIPFLGYKRLFKE